MFRLRFHGRGGHGVKTASRILGTAAFREGLFVQDSPIYGAERRGAPVVAFARIAREPIRERGVIDHPNLILIADESLVRDRSSGVCGGLEGAYVFLNSPHAAAAPLPPSTVTLDLTTLTRDRLGKATALSTGLAAAAARMMGEISLPCLRDAVREELSHRHAPAEMIERNQMLAEDVFQRLSPVPVAIGAAPSAGRVVPVGYDDPRAGAPSIVAAGNAAQRSTGSWRIERPVIDYEVCTRCRLCLLGCPEGAIGLDESGFPVIDYEHCKGCLLCARICPLHGIGREKEVPAW